MKDAETARNRIWSPHLATNVYTCGFEKRRRKSDREKEYKKRNPAVILIIFLVYLLKFHPCLVHCKYEFFFVYWPCEQFWILRQCKADRCKHLSDCFFDSTPSFILHEGLSICVFSASRAIIKTGYLVVGQLKCDYTDQIFLVLGALIRIENAMERKKEI